MSSAAMSSAEEKAKASGSSDLEPAAGNDELEDHELNDQDASSIHGGNGRYGSTKGGSRQRDGRQG